MSLLNILVFYIMLLNRSLKHMSHPTDSMLWFPLSDPMNLSQTMSLLSFLLLLQLPKAKQRLQGRQSLGRKEILNEGEPPVIELLLYRFIDVLKDNGRPSSVLRQRDRDSTLGGEEWGRGHTAENPKYRGKTS